MRRWKHYLLLFLGIGLLGAASFWYVRNTLLGEYLTWHLHTLGFPDATVIVYKTRPTRAKMSVNFDSQSYSLLEVSYSPHDIWQGHIKKITLMNPSFTLRIDESGRIAWPGYHPPLTQDQSPALPLLPVDEVVSRNLHLSVRIPQGSIEATGDVVVQIKGRHWDAQGKTLLTFEKSKIDTTWTATADNTSTLMATLDLKARPSLIEPAWAAPFSDVHTVLDLSLPDTMRVVWAKATWAGGQFQAMPFQINLKTKSARAVLQVQKVPLSDILNVAHIEGLSLTGSVSGNIPVLYEKNQLSFHKGRLKANEPGTLRYVPENPPDFLKGDPGSSTAILLGALSNFHYKSLEATMDGTMGGELTVGLHLSGANPDFYEGHAVTLNLQLRGALDTIWQRSLEPYQLPKALQQKLLQEP